MGETDRDDFNKREREKYERQGRARQIDKREMARVLASVCLQALQNSTASLADKDQRQSYSGFLFVLTGILDLDSGVGLRVGFVNHLSTHLLCEDLHRDKKSQFNTTTTSTT